VFSWTKGYARGDSGTYFVIGKAYGPSNSVLKNVELRVETADTVQIVKTDSDGNFEFEVKWETMCATYNSKLTLEQLNDHRNQDIKVSYKGQEVVIKNEWKKFAMVTVRTRSNSTLNKDLYFKRD